jgi:hypothetical protein
MSRGCRRRPGDVRGYNAAVKKKRLPFGIARLEGLETMLAALRVER